MVSIADYVQNFPAKIVSRLTPQGTTVNEDTLRIDRYNRNLKNGEARDHVYYINHNITLGYDKKRGTLWVKIDPGINNDKLDDLLAKPQNFSQATSKT